MMMKRADKFQVKRIQVLTIYPQTGAFDVSIRAAAQRQCPSVLDLKFREFLYEEIHCI
jgi:hypothetical protein